MRFVETSVFTAVLQRHLDDERYRQLQIAFAQEITSSYSTGVTRVFGTIETMTMVPEPAGAWLLGLGLALVGGLRFKGRTD